MMQVHYILINFNYSNTLYNPVLREIKNISDIINTILNSNRLTKYIGVFQQDCKEIYIMYTHNGHRRQQRLTIGMNLYKIEYFDQKV